MAVGQQAKTKSRTKARAKPSLKAGQRLRLGAKLVVGATGAVGPAGAARAAASISQMAFCCSSLVGFPSWTQLDFTGAQMSRKQPVPHGARQWFCFCGTRNTYYIMAMFITIIVIAFALLAPPFSAKVN